MSIFNLSVMEQQDTNQPLQCVNTYRGFSRFLTLQSQTAAHFIGVLCDRPSQSIAELWRNVIVVNVQLFCEDLRGLLASNRHHNDQGESCEEEELVSKIIFQALCVSHVFYCTNAILSRWRPPPKLTRISMVNSGGAAEIRMFLWKPLRKI